MPESYCGNRNGTYSCQMPKGHEANPSRHRAIFLSAGKPFVLFWGNGKPDNTRPARVEGA